MDLVQTQEIQPHTVIIRVFPQRAAQVLLFNGKAYLPAKNGHELASTVQELAATLPEGDYTCPMEVSVHAQF